eukprot:Hpha_TRINITY_DN18453_c0_g1::TRINITY_DN18453_c0_g1_i1::g.165328::m.165328
MMDNESCSMVDLLAPQPQEEQRVVPQHVDPGGSPNAALPAGGGGGGGAAEDDDDSDLNIPYNAGSDGLAERGAITVMPGTDEANGAEWPSAYSWHPQHRRRPLSRHPPWKEGPLLGQWQTVPQSAEAGRRAPRGPADADVSFAPAQYVYPPPLPLAAVGGQRPDVAFAEVAQQREEDLQRQEEDEQRRIQAQEEREAERIRQGQEATPASLKINNWLWRASSKLERSFVRAHTATERRVRSMYSDRHSQAFAASFPSLIQRVDTLIAAYSCKVISDGVAVAGDLFLSEGHLCFTQAQSGFFGKAVTAYRGAADQPPPVRFFIQWEDVLSVRPAVTLAAAENGVYILPLPSTAVLADSLQVFSRMGTVVELLGFGGMGTHAAEAITSSCDGDALSRCFRFVDHLWRAKCAAVPDASVDWGENGGTGGGAGRQESGSSLQI